MVTALVTWPDVRRLSRVKELPRTKQRKTEHPLPELRVLPAFLGRELVRLEVRGTPPRAKESVRTKCELRTILPWFLVGCVIPRFFD